ncbi:MAG: Perillic acid-CoA ligase GeoC [Hydrocarboniphaga sp.]|uniref:long-chain-fatty-acid--CoA ligase n=1 Tax=Hydrocarboniphaga sp. TaxID=2033016 RepID=UPI00261C81F7|nr:long-chain-fatty-acid--CoA ligase [Hydrocarboniphaga sp.]MDB5971640.1 Perillic acid-CoA ligase GeoC [Hydrocarboniphaga sp.]
MWLYADIKALGDIPRYQARALPDKIAINDASVSISFKVLDENSNRIANGLLDLDLPLRSHVGFLGKNSARYFEILFGVSKSGHALSPLNWRLAPSELAQVIDDSQAPLVFYDREFAALIGQVTPRCANTVNFIELDPGKRDGSPFDVWFSAFDAGDPQVEIDPRQTALLMYTSGTTGRPKGAQIQHQALNLMRLSEHLEPALLWTAADVMLTVMPNFHLVGTGLSLQCLYNGSTLSVLPMLEIGELLRCIARDRPTVCAMVPTAIQMLLDHPDCANTDLSSLRLVMYAGSPISARLLQRAITEMKCRFMQFYGATETGGAATLLRPEQHRIDDPQKLKSCGTPLPLIDVRIVDESGADLPTGRIGEMLVRTPGSAMGYWNQPEASAAAFQNGWYRSGDVAYRDDEGLIYIVDRVKDMIVTGGENVYSTEVEQALQTHPAVLQCAVIGLPDLRWGEKVTAVVVLASGMDIAAADLVAHCRERIAGYKLPKTIVFRDALPMSPAGKLLKRVLRDQLAADEAKL